LVGGDVLLEGCKQTDGFVVGLLTAQLVGLEDKGAVFEGGGKVLAGLI
jgi:hypothetical protein